MEILDNSFEGESAAILTKTMKKYLTEAAKWGRFLAIFSFILWVFVVLAVFEAITDLPIISAIIPSLRFNFNAGVFFNILLLMFALIGFFPTSYLYKFSVKILKNVPTMTAAGIEDALKNLKSLLKFYGVFIGIILGLYAFIILILFVNELVK